MEVNAFKPTKLEANKQKSPQTKEIVSISDSPPDVGRPLVPPEDLDRVDGIRPSSSRTRAVALLPAIEESVEEGSESLQLEAPGAQSKHGRRRTSSKPMLTSISEERIPRLWEYPLGGRGWERARSPGHALGAGEAPPTQSQRDATSHSTLDKTPDVDAGLAEAGDAESKEGNRSNHALGEPDSGPGEKDGVDGEQNIPLTAICPAEAIEGVDESRPESGVGTYDLEHSTSSQNDCLRSGALIGLEACSGAESSFLGDENKGVQEMKEVGRSEAISVVVMEESERNSSVREQETENEIVEVNTDNANKQMSLLGESIDETKNFGKLDKEQGESEEKPTVLCDKNIVSMQAKFAGDNMEITLKECIKKEERGNSSGDNLDSFAHENDIKCDLDEPVDEHRKTLSFDHQEVDGNQTRPFLLHHGKSLNFSEEFPSSGTKFNLLENSVDEHERENLDVHSVGGDDRNVLLEDTYLQEHNFQIFDGVVKDNPHVEVQQREIREDCLENFGNQEEVCLSKESPDVLITIHQLEDLRDETEVKNKEDTSDIDKTECFNASCDLICQTKEIDKEKNYLVGDVLNQPKEFESGDKKVNQTIGDEAENIEVHASEHQDSRVDSTQGIEGSCKKILEGQTVGNLCDEQLRATLLNEEKNTLKSVDSAGHIQKEQRPEPSHVSRNGDETEGLLRLLLNETEIVSLFEHGDKSEDTDKSDVSLEVVVEIGDTSVTTPENLGWYAVLPGQHKKESCVEESAYGTTGDKVHATGSICHTGHEQIMTEVTTKEIVSPEDSIISTSGLSRAKGSGSDSMVAEGTISSADTTGARESHSDHTSCSDKVDQTAKAKDGSTKSRGRERERTKRKRADREDREERAGSPGAKQTSLKNAVGDVQAETEDTVEALDDDKLQARVRNSQGHDFVGLESRTIRAAISGDVRDDALKSTCGLESQTVTSLDDPPSENVDSASLWEQEQIWEDPDSSTRSQSHSSPKGVPASRFGKRTQLHRQKQGSPQEQAPSFQGTEKNNDQMKELGLGDSEFGSSVKTSVRVTALAEDPAWNSLYSTSNIGQDESCNNPVDPISAMENSDSDIRNEVEVRVDDNPVAHSAAQDISQTGEQELYHFEHDIVELGSDQMGATMLIETAEPNSEENSIREVNGDSFELPHPTTKPKELDDAETNNIADSESAALNQDNEIFSENYTPRLDPENVNISYNLAGDNSECKVEDGAVCCRAAEAPGPRSTINTISTVGTTSSGDDSDAYTHSDSSSTSVASSKIGNCRGSGKSKRMSNFDRLFPPMMCTPETCFRTVEPDPPPPNTETATSETKPIKLQSVSTAEEFVDLSSPHGVKFDFPEDISGTADSCNTLPAHECGEHAVIISEEFHFSNHHDVTPVLVSQGDRFETGQVEHLQAPEIIEEILVVEESEGIQPKDLLEEQEGVDRVSESGLSEKSYGLAFMKGSKIEELPKLISNPPEGLHIAHIGDYGGDLETALVSALADAAQDCSPPLASNDSPQNHLPTTATSISDRIVTSPTFKNSDKDHKEFDSLKYSSENCDESYKEHPLQSQPLVMETTDKTFTSINPQRNTEDDFSDSNVQKENLGSLVSETELSQTPNESLIINTKSNDKPVLQEMESHENVDRCDSQMQQIGSEERETCDVAHSAFGVKEADRDPNLEQTSYFTGESGEHAPLESVPVPESEVAEVHCLEHVLNIELALDQGDHPVSDKVLEDTLCQEYQNIKHDYFEGQGNKPIIDAQVMTTLQNATPLTSPFPQRRPHTPVAGDGDWGEKEECDNWAKVGETDYHGESDGGKAQQTQLNTHPGVDQIDEHTKLIVVDQVVTPEVDLSTMKKIDFKPQLVEPEINVLDSSSEKSEEIVEDSEECIPLLKQDELSTGDVSDNDADESMKHIEVDLGVSHKPNTLEIGDKGESDEILSHTPGLERAKLETEIERDIGEANKEEIILKAEDDAYQAGEGVIEISSDKDNIQAKDKEDSWADMVIGEIDKVCDDDQQKLQLEEAWEDFTLPVLLPYTDAPPTLEEPDTFSELLDSRSYNQDELVEERDVEKPVEPKSGAAGRSKDGGKRAKRSKPYGTQESKTSEGQRLVSEGQVKRITVVDVALFPEDTPCVYHPDREESVINREKIPPRPQKVKDASARGRRPTLWRRLKTIFHPSRRRTVTIMHQNNRKECPGREETTATSHPASIIHLRQPAKSDDTLGVVQEPAIRDPPSVSLENWSNARHKVKVRQPGQWRRLKKFRALRQSAEKRGGRLPATMRQVVSKSNFVREAEGDHPSGGRHGGGKASQRKRRFSPDLPPREQHDMTSRSTPEVTQVFKEGEDITDEHCRPDQPTVRLLLKPAPVVASPFESDVSPTCQAIGGEELKQVRKGEDLEGNKPVSHYKEMDVTGTTLNKASTYNGKDRAQPTLCHDKDKANTYQGKGGNHLLEHPAKVTPSEGSRANKSCNLM